jgi:hypothetical protein
MTPATLPTLRPPDVASPEHHEPLDRALEELVKDDQWIVDFIRRLNCAIEEITRKK